jgi:hypothetical protein
VAVTVITSNSGLPPLYFIKHYVPFNTFPSEMITVGQDQEFCKTSMVKQHLHEQCIQYNYTLLKWVTFIKMSNFSGQNEMNNMRNKTMHMEKTKKKFHCILSVLKRTNLSPYTIKDLPKFLFTLRIHWHQGYIYLNTTTTKKV